ncbi:hypothetical protein WH96_06290 [Kiloniella spongiae]|uniref:Uncharacterized protein n=2 Tax=Kiloniella spongiae TaxID=1489064 RepID=A0A0H2MI50_9PROT|nr:hypothetical protein WH96_06290 [Kiloniella spongiae]
MVLVGCQTTSNANQDKAATQTKSDDNYSHHHPLHMAKSITNIFELKHALTSGEFKHYDQKTLDTLALDRKLVDIPGKAVIYRYNYQDITDPAERQKVAKLFDDLKSKPGAPHSHIVFFEKLKDRILNMTPEESSKTATCMADYTWKDFPDNQKETFNKLALGIDTTSEEILDLAYTLVATKPSGKIPKSVKCTLVPMGLYSELKTRFRLY